jgi:uncharacterized protein YjbI with pentapeptide repeats
MTRTSLFPLSILLLTVACEDTAPIEETGSNGSQTETQEPDRSNHLDSSDFMLDPQIDRPVQQLVCSTHGWPGASGLSEVVRFQFEQWADGTSTVEVEEGFAHPDVADSLGLEPTIRRYSNADISWEDDFVDANFGGENMWLFKHWSEIEGLWEGYIYDLEFNGGDVLNCGGMVVNCWEPGIEAPFHYDPDSGLCTDDNGEVGSNPWSLPMVRDTGDGQCADLRWYELNEGEYQHADLSGWDLRGADLESSQLFFSNLIDARLEGANLSSLEYGYADITGSIDDFTDLPVEGCEFQGDDLICQR